MKLIHRLEPLFWILFGAGGFVAAFFLPGLVFCLAIAGPLGWFDPYATDYHRMYGLVSSPVGLKPITRADFDEFVECFRPGAIADREPTWSDDNPDGRWRCYDYEDLLKRDKVSLDLFWLRDESLEDSDSLPEPDVLATEIADDLQAALEQFAGIAQELGED